MYYEHPVELLEPSELSAMNTDNVILVQVTSAELFAQAHIPGAVLVTPQELVCGIPPASGKLPALADLERLFNRIGYQPDCKIIAFDDEGGGWAGRFLNVGAEAVPLPSGGRMRKWFTSCTRTYKWQMGK